MTKPRFMKLLFVSLLITCLSLLSIITKADDKGIDWAELSSCSNNAIAPFKASGDYFSVWDGKDYTKLFIKGMNLGIAKPGTLPGELLASREDYQKWFKEIKELGYNVIRLYTLHFPHFYDELANYNNAHPSNPLLVFHGIWLDETEDYDFFNQTSIFNTEIEHVVNAVHGNANVDVRFGKAYGIYTTDISKWVAGYIIGREVYPDEVKLANQNHPEVTSFSGSHLSIQNATPSEAWITARLDKVVSYEYQNYATQRPVGFSSWPTLDPITHPTEALRFNGYEDSQSLDLTKISRTDAPAGFFISYHAYPYYPDFISDDPGYQSYSDEMGPNSYLGYLSDLKAHYQNIPLLIAEFGIPTSWGTSRFSHSLMHHGGVSEYQQGVYSIRMLKNIEEVGAAGGIQFSWIDEWFKQNWRTNPLENADNRYLWHNLLNPEQNYGIITQNQPIRKQETIGTFSNSNIEMIKAVADYRFLNLTVRMKTETFLKDTLWLALDTYDAGLGESILPDGSSITKNGNTLRAEYALRIIPGDTVAKLFVTHAYDMFSIQADPRVAVNQSTPTDGQPWDIVRWKNKAYTNNTQYLGNLEVAPTSSSPYSFLKAVTWNVDSISIRLPWTIINFKDPSQKKVMHYEGVNNGGEVTEITTDRVSDGVAVTAVLKGEILQTSRYTWDNWDAADVQTENLYERRKQGVSYIADHLPDFNSAPIGACDDYEVRVGEYIEINAEEGLLANDMDFDNDYIEVVIPDGHTALQGDLYVHPDGSFAYEPYETASGTDQFMYYATDGNKYSRLITVNINLITSGSSSSTPITETGAAIFPNPTQGEFQISLSKGKEVKNITISNATGGVVKQISQAYRNEQIDVSDQLPGIYYVSFEADDKIYTQKIIKY